MYVFSSSQEYLNKKLYTNKPTKDYFHQFNTSSRWSTHSWCAVIFKIIQFLLQMLKIFVTCISNRKNELTQQIVSGTLFFIFAVTSADP